MTELNGKVKAFFDRYERANADFEMQAIAAFYADVFMFADPQGVHSVKKEDFVKLLPRRKDFFKLLGLASSRVESCVASELDTKYVLVKVVWKLRFEPKTGDPIDSENSSTYILSAIGGSFEIVFQLDHQDLTKKVHDLGLK